MTDVNKSEQTALTLPGLDDLEDRRGVSTLERAIRRTIAELDRRGEVSEIDAGKLQLALELAEVITLKKQTRRASTIGNDMRVLMEILDSFTEDKDSDADAALQAAMAAWSAELGLIPAPPPPASVST